MKALTGKELAKLLERHGWKLARVKGSHHVFVKPNNPARISVPIHSSRSLKVGLLKHLLKLAEINENDI